MQYYLLFIFRMCEDSRKSNHIEIKLLLLDKRENVAGQGRKIIQFNGC